MRLLLLLAVAMLLNGCIVTPYPYEGGYYDGYGGPYIVVPGHRHHDHDDDD